MKNLIKRGLVVFGVALLFFTFSSNAIDSSTDNEERLINLYEKVTFVLDIIKEEDQRGLEDELRIIKERLEEMIDRYLIRLPDPLDPAPRITTSLNGSTASSVTVYYGGVINFKWDSFHADECAVSGYTSGSGTSGEILIANFAKERAVFEVECKGRGGSTTKTVNVIGKEKTNMECQLDIVLARITAQNKVCAQVTQEMSCVGIRTYLAKNSCEIEELKKRGWTKVTKEDEASGSLGCHSSGPNHITLKYTIDAGGSPVTLFRNNDIKVESWPGNSSYKGNITDENLLPSYSYNYSLKEGTTPSSPRIAHVSCVTEKATSPAPEISLSVNNISREKVTLQRGSTATVRWRAAYADSCTLSGYASGSGTSGTRVFRNFSPLNTHFTVFCRGKGGTSRERILVETIDFPDDIDPLDPIEELTYDIDSVSGLKSIYSPGEKIELTIKASETRGRVSDDRGFAVGVSIFPLNSNDPVESTVMGSRDVVYNSRTDSWSATIHAPTSPQQYRLEVALWCSRHNSYCYETYDGERGQAPQIEKKFYIRVARSIIELCPAPHSINFGRPTEGVNEIASWQRVSDASNGYEIEYQINGGSWNSASRGVSQRNTPGTVRTTIGFTQFGDAGNRIRLRVRSRCDNNATSNWTYSTTRTVQAAPTIDEKPHIYRVSPRNATIGDAITIYGRNLIGTVPSGIGIEFLKNGKKIGVVNKNDIKEDRNGQTLQFKLDRLVVSDFGWFRAYEDIREGSYQIRVWNDEGTSNLINLEVVANRGACGPAQGVSSVIRPRDGLCSAGNVYNERVGPGGVNWLWGCALRDPLDSNDVIGCWAPIDTRRSGLIGIFEKLRASLTFIREAR